MRQPDQPITSRDNEHEATVDPQAQRSVAASGDDAMVVEEIRPMEAELCRLLLAGASGRSDAPGHRRELCRIPLADRAIGSPEGLLAKEARAHSRAYGDPGRT